MNLNRDNYELIMFDLLEGNLTEKEELAVMKAIEEDEFLFREWKLFKSTVLIADKDVVYTGKSSLLKKEAAIVPMFSKWIAVAASVCILAAVVFFWPASEVTPIAESDKVEEVVPTPSVPETNAEEVVVENNDALVETDDLFISDRETKIVRKVVEYKSVLQNNESYITNESPVTDLEIPEVIEDKVYEQDVPSNLIVKLPDAVELRKKVIDELEPENTEGIAAISKPDSEKSLTRKEKAIEFVTKNPPSRIKEKAIGIIALLSHPKLKFKPDFKGEKPVFNIELETTGYQAIASIQPFKNRN